MTKTSQFILTLSLVIGLGCSSAPKEVEQSTAVPSKSYVDETPAFYSDTIAITTEVDTLSEKEKLALFKSILPKARKMDDYSSFTSIESVATFQNIQRLMQNYQDSSVIRMQVLQSIYKNLIQRSKEEFEVNPIDIKTKLELAGIKSEINEIIARSKQNNITLELQDTMSK
ncbi:MAG: hypothetical protein R2852_02245 [Bacteroidia bacterium]